jgi:hypothetical protein
VLVLGVRLQDADAIEDVEDAHDDHCVADGPVIQVPVEANFDGLLRANQQRRSLVDPVVLY